jgi:SAM-dependent methyltransferase
MSHELSKSITRRLGNPNFVSRYFVGNGVDIGCGDDPLSRHALSFARMMTCLGYDKQSGDAQYMNEIPDETFDFVHSSHCLEHLPEPYLAIQEWLRILKPGGYMIVMVPDEDLYEQGVWPSIFNDDHKHTFTIRKAKSWSPKSINVVDLIDLYGVKPIKIELVDTNYDYGIYYAQFKVGRRTDQSLIEGTEVGIELVLKKL